MLTNMCVCYAPTHLYVGVNCTVAAIIQTVARSIPNRKDFLADAYQRHAHLLKGYLMRTVSQADAEDLLHDVYVRMASHKGLGMIDNMKAFMFTTATNLLRDRWRRANACYAPTLVNFEDLNLIAGGSDPAEVVDWCESLARVKLEIERLPEKSRLAFELNRMGGFSYAEIADVMAVSVSMIEKHISLALRRLRTAL